LPLIPDTAILRTRVGFTAKSLHQVFWLAGFREVKILPPRAIPSGIFETGCAAPSCGDCSIGFRFAYFVQDYTVPAILDKNIVIVGKKLNKGTG